MPDLKAVLADSNWLPHRYDAGSNRVMFARLDRETVRRLAFLADYEPSAEDQHWVATDELQAINLKDGVIKTGPIHFVFHSAFVRSTLLSRALDFPGKAIGLSEPAILNDLAYASRDARKMLPLITSLLARPFGDGEAVVIKPSNTANGLIVDLMAQNPAAKAALLTGSVENFLRSVHKKGMFGRRWARRLYSHVMQFAPLDLGMSQSDQFEATDLQYAGLAWFLQQRHFSMLIDSTQGDRFRSLESDVFNQRRSDTLSRMNDFMALGIGSDAIAHMIESPVFTTHAKGGGDIGERLETEAKAADSQIVEEEIAMVAQWIGQISQQAGVSGLRNPLL